MITAKQAIERAVTICDEQRDKILDLFSQRMEIDGPNNIKNGDCMAFGDMVAEAIGSRISAIDLERKPRSDRKQERDAEIVGLSDSLTQTQLAEKFSISKQRVSIILKASRDKA